MNSSIHATQQQSCLSRTVAGGPAFVAPHGKPLRPSAARHVLFTSVEMAQCSRAEPPRSSAGSARLLGGRAARKACAAPRKAFANALGHGLSRPFRNDAIDGRVGPRQHVHELIAGMKVVDAGADGTRPDANVPQLSALYLAVLLDLQKRTPCRHFSLADVGQPFACRRTWSPSGRSSADRRSRRTRKRSRIPYETSDGGAAFVCGALPVINENEGLGCSHPGLDNRWGTEFGHGTAHLIRNCRVHVSIVDVACAQPNGHASARTTGELSKLSVYEQSEH